MDPPDTETVNWRRWKPTTGTIVDREQLATCSKATTEFYRQETIGSDASHIASLAVDQLEIRRCRCPTKAYDRQTYRMGGRMYFDGYDLIGMCVVLLVVFLELRKASRGR